MNNGDKSPRKDPSSPTRFAPSSVGSHSSPMHLTPPRQNTQRPKSPSTSGQTQRNHSPSGKQLTSSPKGQNSNPTTPVKTPESKKYRGSPKKSPYITPTRSPKPSSNRSPGSNFSPNRAYSTGPTRVGVKISPQQQTTSSEGSQPTEGSIQWEIGDVYRAAGVFAYARKPVKGSEADHQLVGLVLCEFRENKQRLTFPGGKIDPKDLNDPLKTALREFHEETRGVFDLSEAEMTAQFVSRFPDNCFYAHYGKYFFTALEVPYMPDIFESFRSRPSIEDKTDKLFWLELPMFKTRQHAIKIDGEEYEWHRFTMSLLKDDNLQKVISSISAVAISPEPATSKPDVDSLTDSLASLNV